MRISLMRSALALEADAGQIRQRHVAVLHPHAVREPAERLEQVGVRLVAAQSQARGDVKRHLVPAVRNAASSGTSRIGCSMSSVRRYSTRP